MTKELLCKDMMSPEQVTLHPDDTVSTAFKLMRNKGMRFLPIIDDNGCYIGVFTSPTLIRLMLPRAITIQLGGKNPNKGLKNLHFFSLEEDDFYDSLKAIKDEPVRHYLSEPQNIPVIDPDTPIMEGILLLHQYKRHVILVDSHTKKFVGVLSINSVLRQLFDEDHEL